MTVGLRAVVREDSERAIVLAIDSARVGRQESETLARRVHGKLHGQEAEEGERRKASGSRKKRAELVGWRDRFSQFFWDDAGIFYESNSAGLFRPALG